MPLKPTDLIQRHDHLKSIRSVWENHWQEVADFTVPNKSDIVTDRTRGDKRNINLLDNTTMNSNELLAAALQTLLTNPNGVWFEMQTGVSEIDEDDDVRKWLQMIARDILIVLNNSNFQTEVHELYTDLGAFGTAGMCILDDEESIVRFFTKPISELVIDEDSKGRINQIYRKFEWPARKIIDEFGEENVPESVKKADILEENKNFHIIHGIYPKEVQPKGSIKKFSFTSQYVLVEEKFDLRIEGFNELPFVVPRWSKAPGEMYGRSPGMTALPDSKQLNAMTETLIKAGQKVVDPPLQVPDDGFVLPIITRPAGLNFYRSGTQDRIEPILNNARVDIGEALLQDSRERIKRAFFVDQLRLPPVDSSRMTATEIMQRTEESMRLLAPMLARLQAEFLRPLIDRVFNIMMGKGLIDKNKIPKPLRGSRLNVRYSSIIAKAQRASEAQDMVQTIELLSPFISLDPSIADNINGDVVFRKLAVVQGFPQEAIRDQAEVTATRQQRAEAQQAALEQEEQARQVDAAAKLGPLAQAQQQG